MAESGVRISKLPNFEDNKGDLYLVGSVIENETTAQSVKISTNKLIDDILDKLNSSENIENIKSDLIEVKNNLSSILDNETSSIDSWNDIENFLNGFSDSETLAGVLNDLKLFISSTYQLKGDYASSSDMNDVKEEISKLLKNETSEIDSWNDVKNFLAGINDTETLNEILNEIKTELADKVSKEEINEEGIETFPWYINLWSLMDINRDNIEILNLSCDNLANALDDKAPLVGGKIPEEYLPEGIGGGDVVEYEKEVSGSDWKNQAAAIEIGKLCYCISTSAGEWQYKLIKNTDGTVDGLEMITPEIGKIYINVNENNYKIYHWSGSALKELSKTSFGRTNESAFRGDWGQELENQIANVYTKQEVNDIIDGLDIGGEGGGTGTLPTYIEADKLKTPVKIWGQEFDGSEDIKGDVDIDGSDLMNISSLLFEGGTFVNENNAKHFKSALEGVTKAVDDSKVIKSIKTYNGATILPIDGSIYAKYGDIYIDRFNDDVNDLIEFKVNPEGNIATKEDLKAIDNQPFVVVDDLPGSDKVDANKIYLIPIDGETADNNKFAEYIYINNEWEKLGEFSADIDLSEYAKSSEVKPLTDWRETILKNITTGIATLYTIDSSNINNATYNEDNVQVNLNKYSIATGKAERNTNQLTINAATSTTAGVMSAEDKKKLDRLSENNSGGGDTGGGDSNADLSEIKAKLEGVTKAADDSKVIKVIKTYNGQDILPTNGVISTKYGDIYVDKYNDGVNDLIEFKVNPGGNIATKDDLKSLNGEVFVVVESLPEQPEDNNKNKIHVVPLANAVIDEFFPVTDLTSAIEDKNSFVEYIWVERESGSTWEKLGEFKADVDLSNLVTEDYLNYQLKANKDIIDIAGYCPENYEYIDEYTDKPGELMIYPGKYYRPSLDEINRDDDNVEDDEEFDPDKIADVTGTIYPDESSLTNLSDIQIEFDKDDVKFFENSKTPYATLENLTNNKYYISYKPIKLLSADETSSYGFEFTDVDGKPLTSLDDAGIYRLTIRGMYSESEFYIYKSEDASEDDDGVTYKSILPIRAYFLVNGYIHKDEIVLHPYDEDNKVYSHWDDEFYYKSSEKYIPGKIYNVKETEKLYYASEDNLKLINRDDVSSNFVIKAFYDYGQPLRLEDFDEKKLYDILANEKTRNNTSVYIELIQGWGINYIIPATTVAYADLGFFVYQLQFQYLENVFEIQIAYDGEQFESSCTTRNVTEIVNTNPIIEISDASTSRTVVTCEFNKYHKVNGKVNMLTIEMPMVEDYMHEQSFKVFFNTDENPQVNFDGTFYTIHKSKNYSISPNSTYELTITYIDDEWLVKCEEFD